MAFTDQIVIRAKAGRGGNGVVRWLHEKGKEYGGPSGGDGGRGGNVIFRAVRDVNILSQYRGRDTFRAENGAHGGNKNMAGKDGKDIVIDVPIGVVVTRKESGHTFELLHEDETIVVLHGGSRGLGNTNFKSSVNQNPEESTDGKEGEEDAFLVELKLIADVGLVGLPNAGKSSILNALTHAKAKVGSYAFTTLEPNLGIFFGYVIADIPGLIEGAHEGKGLGDAFLKHVSRTKLLIHCVPADSENPLKDYETVRQELSSYDSELSRKPEIVFLTKADSVPPEVLEEVKNKLSSVNKSIIPVTILDDGLVKEAGDALSRFLKAN
jgi:GTP-binding protein